MSGLRIGPQLMDGLSAGRSPPRRKRKAVPPIHAVSYHVATDKVPARNGDKFRSIFSDNLQPIATRGKKACGTLLVDKHCDNGCSIKRAPLSVSYYNEISGGGCSDEVFCQPRTAPVV